MSPDIAPVREHAKTFSHREVAHEHAARFERSHTWLATEVLPDGSDRFVVRVFNDRTGDVEGYIRA